MNTNTTETTNSAGTDTTASSTSSAGNGSSSGALSSASRRAGDALDSARTRASEAYSAARERTSAVYGSAREGAARVGQKTAQGVESYPEGAILGGLALGAVVAALLPKTQRESEVLGTYGRRINDAAKEAARAAKEAGRGKLDEAGLSRDAARQKLTDIASSAGEVARTSASAAAQAVKGSAQQQ